jgi:D-serine deaminase-like pyridoxal phosphate-dependent protein
MAGLNVQGRYRRFGAGDCDGHQPDKGWIITDAGWMAMSRDRGTAAQKPTRVMASCAISPARRSMIYWSCRPTRARHRRSPRRRCARRGTLSVGTLLRALHPTMPVPLPPSDRYHVIAGDAQVTAVWPRFSGW